jgi:hypothetical protein
MPPKLLASPAQHGIWCRATAGVAGKYALLLRFHLNSSATPIPASFML